VPNRPSLALAVLVMLVSGYGVLTAWDWPAKAALFPLAIGIPLFCLGAAEAAWVLLGAREEKKAGPMDSQLRLPKDGLRRAALAVGWMLGFFAAIVLLGFPLAVPLFVLLYLRLQGGERWLVCIVTTAAVWGFFYGLFDRLLHLPFPAGWLLSFLR
jgi:hypothetical protein